MVYYFIHTVAISTLLFFNEGWGHEIIWCRLKVLNIFRRYKKILSNKKKKVHQVQWRFKKLFLGWSLKSYVIIKKLKLYKVLVI